MLVEGLFQALNCLCKGALCWGEFLRFDLHERLIILELVSIDANHVELYHIISIDLGGISSLIYKEIISLSSIFYLTSEGC